MRRRSKYVGVCAVFCLLLVRIPGAIAEPTPGSPGAELNEALAGLNTLTADFSQVTVDANNRTIQDNTGELWFESPARFRVVTSDPFAQTLVSNGDDFWSFDADLEQLVIRPLEKDIKQVPILLLGGDTGAVTDEFNVDSYEDERAKHYVLSPRSNEGLFESMTIEFTAQTPSAISIVDSLGQRTRIEFTNANVNAEIDASIFRFEVPGGVDVIDDRDVSS